MNKKVFQIRSGGHPSPFIVGKNQSYKIVTFGYIDKNNPSGNAVIDPLDEKRVIITEIGNMLDGSLVYTAENYCACGVNIEVFDIE